MGYFNIFYKITRIIDMLTRKRNRRAIMVILIIIAVIFILHNKGYCAQSDSDYTTDTSYFILEEYNNLCDTLYMTINGALNNNLSARISIYTTFFDNFIPKPNTYKNYLYLYHDIDSVYTYIYLYNDYMNRTLVDTSLVYNDYMRVPSTSYNITIPTGTQRLRINSNGYPEIETISSDINISVPTILYGKIPTRIVDIMSLLGLMYEDKTDIIDIKQLLTTQNQKLDNINNSLTNTTYDEDVVDFDTDSVDDVDDTEITGLFTGVIGSFSNALNTYGGTITKIIPLPHGRSIRNSKQHCIFTFGKFNRFG